MHQRLKFYTFSNQSGQKDILDFLSFLEKMLSNNHLDLPENADFLKLSIQENFYAILNNFEKLINYLNIDEKWQQKNKHKINISIVQLAEKTRQSVQKILINGALQRNHTNLIFEFNQHKPFVTSVQTIYKLLINTILDIGGETGLDLEKILSLYLMHAATYNNLDAITILMLEYNVSPIKTWPTLNLVTNETEGMIMPILQLTSVKKQETNKKSLQNYWKEQEHNFMFMLHNIDFSKTTIQHWQIQEIFRCAFKNKFLQALNELLQQEVFCEKLVFTEEDLIMIAFSFIAIPDYNPIVNMILNNNNLLTTVDDNKLNKLQVYINTLQKITNHDLNSQRFDHIVIKVALDFLSHFLDRNPENEAIANLLIIAELEQEKLIQENEALLQNNLKLQAEIIELQKQLEKSNLSHLSEKYIGKINANLANQKIEDLEKQLNDYKINAQVIEYKYNFLINHNYRLQETLNMLTYNSPSSTSLEIQSTSEQLIEVNPVSEQQYLKNLKEYELKKTCYFMQNILQKTKQKLEELLIDTSRGLEPKCCTPEINNTGTPSSSPKHIKRRNSYCL